MKFTGTEVRDFATLQEVEAFMDKKQHQLSAFANELVTYENGNIELRLRDKARRTLYFMKYTHKPTELTASEMNLITQSDLS